MIEKPWYLSNNYSTRLIAVNRNLKKELKKERQHEHRVKWRITHPEQARNSDIKRQLKKKELFVDFTIDEWKQKVEQTKGICPICNRPYSNIFPFCATLDHTPPISKAPTGFHYTIDDIQPLCGSCNSSKRDRI